MVPGQMHNISCAIATPSKVERLVLATLAPCRASAPHVREQYYIPRAQAGAGPVNDDPNVIAASQLTQLAAALLHVEGFTLQPRRCSWGSFVPSEAILL